MGKKIKLTIFLFVGLVVLTTTISMVSAGPIFLDPGGPGGGDPIDPDTTPPPKVTGVYADGISFTKAELEWNPSTATDCTHYNIYRDDVRITCVTGRYNTEFLDTDLNPGTVYSYQVSAVDGSSNEGDKSNIAFAVTDEPDPKALKRWEGSFSDIEDEWTSGYIDWMNQYQISHVVNGKYPGNIMSVVLQPRAYTDILGEYNLVYDLAIRAETGIGGRFHDQQVFVNDFGETYSIPAPMCIKKIGVKTTLLPNDGYIADLHENTHLLIDGAVEQCLLGNYKQWFNGYDTLQNLINDGSDGKFQNPTLSQSWWVDWGSSHGIFDYDAQGHVQYGLKIQNNDGGEMFACSPKITKIQDSQNSFYYSVNINYWGKRDSVTSGNNVGVKVIVGYEDGSSDVFFPDNLKITHRDNTWRPYQHLIYTDKRIEHVYLKLVNSEQGVAYFDQLYATEGEWWLDIYGDYNSDGWTYDYTYNDWSQKMRDTVKFNQFIDHCNKALKYAGYIAGVFGIKFGIAGEIAGHLLNFLEKEVPTTMLKGQYPDQFSNYFLFDHMDLDRTFNGNTYDDAYTIACDDVMRVRYDIQDDEFFNRDIIQLKIDVEIWWGYCGDSNDLNWMTQHDTAEYKMLTFYVDITGLEY